MFYGVLGLAALPIGLVAWFVPFIAGLRGKYTVAISWWSFIPCAVALVFWNASLLQFVNKGDMSSIMDVAPTGAWVCVILVAVTVGLNVVALVRGRKDGAR